MTQLAYSYSAIARILDASGFTDEQIAAFLVEKQNATGYIKSSELPPIKKEYEAPVFSVFRHARCSDPLGKAVTELLFNSAS